MLLANKDESAPYALYEPTSSWSYKHIILINV